MKIKSILHAAALRLSLIAIAMSIVMQAFAHETSQVGVAFDATKLYAVSSLSISAEDFFPDDKLEKDTYYDDYTWYKGGDNRSKSDDSGKSYFAWKDSHYIVFKVGEGTYNLKISFRTKNVGRGISILSGPSKDKTLFSEVPENTYTTDVSSIITVDSDEYLYVQGTGGDVLLYSISLSPATPLSKDFTSDIPAIGLDTFWGNNGGDGFGMNNAQGSFYRYFTHKIGTYYAPASTKKMVSINGVKNFKSYELKPGEAVGFKLAPLNVGDNKYRIKVYYYKDGDNTAEADLFTGTNVSSESEVAKSNESIIKDSNGDDTNTRMRTYYVESNNDVYWVKNNSADGKSLYLGGFEILTNKEGYPSGDYEGSWYVEDQADPISNANGGDANVYVAKSHDGVVLTGKAMPLNDYTIDGKKSVMFNGKTWIGVNVPAGATLSFTYTADSKDDGITLNVTPSVDTYADWVGNVSYTNTTNDTQQVWIVGKSENYAYISGIMVTPAGTQPEPSIDDVTPIDKDYVWYLVSGKDEYIGAGNLQADDHTFLQKGFATNKPETYTLYNRSQIAYRTDNSVIGFKIKSGKKGVINIYYKEENTRYLYLSEDGTDRKLTNGTISDTKPTTVARWHFDTTGGTDKTYWITNTRSSQVWFMGYEVLFDEGNNGGVQLTKDVAYNVAGTETLTNAIGSDTYSAIKSGTDASVGGSSMILRDGVVANGAMVSKIGENNWNAILVKIPADCKMLNVTGYLAGGASFKIYKGTASAPNTTKSVEITGSGNIDKTASLDELSDISGDVYWITSDNAAGAYVTSVTPKDGTFTELQPTDVNYIYKVSGVPSSANGGVQNSGDCNGRIMFVDQNSSAWTDGNSKMNVLGTEVTPVVIENGTDFFAVKVDEGPAGVKTGYVKVYFNGGSSAAHKMEELPLSDPMYSGWNSTYDRDSHVITFDGGGGGRGWWFGNEGAGARDLSSYNKINIQLGEVTGSPNLQVVVQCANGAYAAFPYDSTNKRILGDLTDQTKWYDSKDGEKFDIKKISQIYIQDNNVDNTTASVEIKSARLMNKPVVIATDNDADPANGYTEVFGGKIYDLPDGKVYEYPFDLSKKGTQIPQLIWITGAGAGTTNIAAIEVLYDSNHAKVVEWYVNKDTKMIVGSDDPSFKMEFDGETLEYPTGYDEYVTFYMSSGRQANVSFIMPEAVREVYDWQMALAKQTYGVDDDGYVIENDSLKASYGSHTIESTVIHNPKGLNMNKGKTTYDRNKGQKKDMNGITGNLYGWYTNSYDFPSKDKDDNYWAGVKITATQKENGKTSTETVDGKLGEWNIYMRFVAYKAPVAAESSNKVTVTAGQSGKIYYTVDSSDPDNLGAMSADDIKHSSTENYSSGVDVSKMNCIFKAAQYITTPCYFYDDISKGKDSATGNVLKVVSSDLAIVNDDPSVVYVKNKATGDDELFNTQEGGYMLTIPTGDKMADVTPHEQKYNANPFMYLTLGGKNHPYWAGSGFNLCGTDWKASDDSGLKTYLDSYKYKFDVVSVKNIKPWNTGSNQNQNPYTECNGGIGGADTEDGGMFLQPISGTILRFEPEYDGVITVWLRQNGCLDNNTQELGTFSRRPVFVMDENGRVMRRSKIKPTAAHYMGINGVWAINSSMCEERSQVEHTWLHEVAKQVFEDHPLYAGRFGDDFPNRWEVDGLDHSGHILYGWWYKGFDLNATRSKITSASHVSRFEYMEPELLYRSDKIFNMEMNQLGLNNGFAKYGFELPNFQYVRYRIPVKAGKTYYIGGRGTKNGFSAIRFDALAPNTSHLGLDDLRYSDNPEVVENPDQSSTDYLKVTSNWSNNGNHDYKGTYVSPYDLTGKTEKEVLDAYGKLDKITIYETPVAGEPTNESKIKSQVEVDGKLYGMDEYDLGNLVGKTVDVELNRTFRAYNWHPIILPFSLSETRVEQYFGEGTVILYLDPAAHTMNNQLDENTGKSWTSVVSQALEGTKLSFTIHRYQMLYANTPAFICPTFKWSDAKKSPATNNVKPTVSNGAVSGITFRRVTLDGSNSRNFLSDGCIGYAINNDYEVVGSYDQTVQSGDIYFVNNTNPNGGEGNVGAQLLHSSNKSVTMKGTRVWIRPRSGVANAAPILTVGSKGFSDFEEDSESAGISDIVADDYTIEGYDIEDDSVYDLLGRKVGQGSLDGLLKGVYIFHGKKVYVK